MTLRCLIIDDEPIARSILQKYISKTPDLELSAALDNGLAAISFLNQQAVDLIFLDINMPEFTGIDLLKSMRNPPAVIITTAYSEYGAESYDYEVTDYLLKPIPFDRFLKAIQKVLAQLPVETESDKDINGQSDFIFLKEENQTHKVFLNDIRYVQAYGNYLKVFLQDKMLIVRKTIVEMENEALGSLVRIHKSYLVSLRHISKVEGNMVYMSPEEQLPVGKVYRPKFDEKLKRLR